MSALIVALLAATLTGCGMLDGQLGGGGGEAQQPLPPDATEQPSEQPAEQPSQEAPSGEGQAPAQPGQPIATREVHNDGATLRVDVTGLKRSDRLITLSWNVTVTETNSDGYWQITTELSTNRINGYDVSAVTLVDPVNSKRYLVARSPGEGDEEGECVCSSTAGGQLEAGDTVSHYATFTAPPPDVTKVNVDLIVLGTLNDVPIS